MPGPAQSLFDGNWVDLTSIGVGLVYACVRTYPVKPFDLRAFASNLINGIGLFPLLLLCAGVASTKLLQELISSSRITLFIAGVFSLVALVQPSPSKASSPAGAGASNHPPTPPIDPPLTPVPTPVAEGGSSKP